MGSVLSLSLLLKSQLLFSFAACLLLCDFAMLSIPPPSSSSNPSDGNKNQTLTGTSPSPRPTEPTDPSNHRRSLQNAAENQRFSRNHRDFHKVADKNKQNGYTWRNRYRNSPNLAKSNGETSRFGGNSQVWRSDTSGKVRNGGLEVDSDDESWMCSDEDYDSESNDLSFEAVKNSKWVRGFLKLLDSMSMEQLRNYNTHCPACRNGVGSIAWYRGLQAVLAHARSVTSKRVKLHRKFAEILEDEMKKREAGFVVSEAVGKCKGLMKIDDGDEIVWPPMVIVQNTMVDRSENGKCLGMGKELISCFQGFKAIDAKLAYGPGGHRGTGVLIFETSAVGYSEAERLHEHFVKQGCGKKEWEIHGGWRYSNGKRGLYGYLAAKEDLETFNKHCKGTEKLKFKLRSYQMMVADPSDKMDENHPKQIEMKKEVAEYNNNALEETCEGFGKNLHITQVGTQKQKRAHRLNNWRVITDY